MRWLFGVVSLSFLMPAVGLADEAAAPVPEPQKATPKRLDELKARSDALAARIEEAANRVRLLAESVLAGAITPTRLLIRHSDEMGSGMNLEDVTYRLDGREVLNAQTRPGIVDAREFEVFNGPIPPGPHELSVTMTFRGTGFGIFTYLKGYKFTLNSNTTIQVTEGRLTRLTAAAFAKADVTLEPKDRLSIRYDVEVVAPGAREAR